MLARSVANGRGDDVIFMASVIAIYLIGTAYPTEIPSHKRALLLKSLPSCMLPHPPMHPVALARKPTLPPALIPQASAFTAR